MKTRNGQLLLIKAHYFFFYAALGPILPFMSVIGKQLGISETTMGSIFTFTPILYLILKPLYGYIIDYFGRFRTTIFTMTVTLMGVFYSLIYFVPRTLRPKSDLASNASCSSVFLCDLRKSDNSNWSLNRICDLTCQNGFQEISVELLLQPLHCEHLAATRARCNVSQNYCNISCDDFDQKYVSWSNLWQMNHFWLFVVVMSLGSICFNILASVSDAICFNVLGKGNEDQYGHQRLWGTVGYGISAFLAGYCIDYLSAESTIKNNNPAFILLIFFIFLDMIVCSRLRFTQWSSSHGIANQAYEVLKTPPVRIFVFFVVFIGISDGFLVYYLFWYMEDVASKTGFFDKIRLIEGLTVLTQSFGGELVVFPLSGKIIQRVGYSNALGLCFLFFSVRLCILSIIPNPWWTLPIEFVLHGLTYAFSYTTIVGYVGAISPPAVQGTLQGIVSGIYDGFGYAVGSFVGGLLCTQFSLQNVFRIFGIISLLAGILYRILNVFFPLQILSEKNAVYFNEKQVAEEISSEKEELNG